jgi:hypothetical protein
MGNSTVPYPIAFGKEYIYYPDEATYIKRNELETPISAKYSNELFFEYYGFIGENKKKQHKMDLKCIVRYTDLSVYKNNKGFDE